MQSNSVKGTGRHADGTDTGMVLVSADRTRTRTGYAEIRTFFNICVFYPMGV